MPSHYRKQSIEVNTVEETWRNIISYVSYYQVSNHGRVKSLDRLIPNSVGKGCRLMPGRILKATGNKNGNGYPQVMLSKGGKPKPFDIHRLVLEAFVGPCPDGMECRHLDGDRSNCHLDNLCWGTPSRNQRDREIHGTGNHGERNRSAKLTESQVHKIRKLYATGNYSQTKLSAIFGVGSGIISMIVRRLIWRHI